MTGNVARFLGLGTTVFPTVKVETLCMKYVVQLNLPGIVNTTIVAQVP